ncbi:MAG: hypothetical protein IIT58_12765 [Treponema sp.]|nr:hypothetical protein [Treponema sp.]
MKKKPVLLIFAFLFSQMLFGLNLSFQAGFAPSIIINTSDGTQSAVSPVVYPVNFSVNLKIKEHFYFEPRLSFFWYYTLMTERGCYPAEIENRTGTALSFLVDLPVGYTKTFGEKHLIQAGAGPSILSRFAFLSNNVNADDWGATGSAADDINAINSWFWDKAQFLYIKAHFLYLYQINESIKIGPELSFYLPIGSFIDSKPMNNSIISAGLTVRF